MNIYNIQPNVCYQCKKQPVDFLIFYLFQVFLNPFKLFFPCSFLGKKTSNIILARTLRFSAVG